MVARFFALATVVVACIALADLVAHPSGTQQLANAGVQAETVSTNALLGSTSKVSSS